MTAAIYKRSQRRRELVLLSLLTDTWHGALHISSGSWELPRLLSTPSRGTASNFLAVWCQFICNASNSLSILISFFPGKEGRELGPCQKTRVHEMIELVSSFKVHFSSRLTVLDLCSSATTGNIPTRFGDSRSRALELTPQKSLT